MKLETYYHLYETAHTGLIDKPVNLVPESWNRFTVTDGGWMTSATLDALCYRDLFLAQQIQVVDEDKKHHYTGIGYIEIDNDSYTISVRPFEYNYYFTNGLNLNNEFRYVSLPLPETIEGRPSEYSANRLHNSGGLDYEISRAHSEADINPHYNDYENHTITAKGLVGGDIQSFPPNANTVYVSYSKQEWNDKRSLETYKKGTYDYWEITGSTINYEDGIRQNGKYDDLPVVKEGVGGEYTLDETGGEHSQEPIFDPTDTTHFSYNDGTTKSLQGGKNYITDTINMIPDEVLFIY